MMRVLYIVALVLTLGFMVADAYYVEEVSSARWSSYYSYDYSYDDYGYNSYDSYDSGRDDELTIEAGIMSMIVFFFFIALYVLSLVKIKTTTMKVFSIIGLSLTGIFLVWDALMMSSPGGLSFDEVGPFFVIYGIIMLAFSIIGTIHAFKKKA